MSRRRPVPRWWREDHHRLSTTTHAWGSGFRRASRTKGYCSCGARWPDSPRTDNLMADDVRDEWLDHVEEAYYADPRRPSEWRVWFAGGNHADVWADSEADARLGPWNPSFGSVVRVEDVS